jgi:hypothetical protein
MVEALDDWVGTKIVPSRDHGHFIDGSLSLDSFRVGWMPVTTALGHSTKSLRSSPLRGGKSREPVAEGAAAAGGKVTAINKPTVGVQRATHDQAHKDDLRASP